MVPTDAEVFAWLFIAFVLAAVLIWGCTHSEPEQYMSDEWLKNHRD